MAADNVKTALRLPSGVNEDFISNLIWQHHHQQQHQKISTNKNKVSANSHQGPSKYTQEKTCAEFFL